MAGSPGNIKPILYALFANGAIAIAKGVAAVITSSGAMLAECIHSIADTGNQVLLLFGLKQAKRPPTPDYPLGFGKSIFFWSFLVAVMLFSIGGMFSLYEGVHKLLHPEPINRPWIAIGVLVFAIIAEGLSLAGCMKAVNAERHGRPILQWFRESRSSELIVVFGEDIAALLGLVFALLAVLVTMITGNPLYDAIGTLMIGVLLLVIAVFVAIEVKALLIGQSVEPRLLEQMREFLQAQPEVASVYNLLTMQLGPDAMVAVKAAMTPQGSEKELLNSINRVERAFREAFPSVIWLFFEPDHADD
jgi:cation diffusion facilitator family transporter